MQKEVAKQQLPQLEHLKMQEEYETIPKRWKDKVDVPDVSNKSETNLFKWIKIEQTPKERLKNLNQFLHPDLLANPRVKL